MIVTIFRTYSALQFYSEKVNVPLIRLTAKHDFRRHF